MIEDNRVEIAINMLQEMISQAEESDRRYRAQKIAEGQGEQAVGESWVVFHLKTLKELLENGPV